MNKILICHPDEKTRETLKLTLGDYYNLILTDSLPQCLHCIEHAKNINTLLIGVENLRSVKKLKKEYPKLKIIVVGGYKKISGKEVSLRNMAGYIMKPFKSDEILSIVRTNQEEMLT